MSEQRVALVTGGAKRLGRHLALDLAARGYAVVVHYRSSAGPAAEVVAQIEEAGGRAWAFAADLTQPDAVAALFAAVTEREGRLDLLVYNVGNYDPKPLEQVTPAEWDEHVGANLNGAWACCYFARPLMAQGGHVVMLGYAGLDALVGNPEATVYQITKTGLLVLVKSMAEAWAPTIRANMISPGQLENSVDLPPDVQSAIPAQRAGTLQDIAQALRYLDDADYVTGVNIDVAGGYRLRGSVR